MPDKIQNYVQLAGQTAAGLTKNLESWTGFLNTASRLYKYPFADQILIHAQNPKRTKLPRTATTAVPSGSGLCRIQ